MKVNVEYTDTFAGEANYAWVRRKSFECDAATKKPALVRKAKKLMELSGRHTSQDFSDMIEVRPTGSCTIMFITIEY